MTNSIKQYLYILMLALLPAVQSLAMLSPALEQEKQGENQSKEQLGLSAFMLIKQGTHVLGLPKELAYKIIKIMRDLIIEGALESGDYVFESGISGYFRPGAMEFSPDGSLFVDQLRQMRLQDGKVIEHGFDGLQLCFSTDGKLIALKPQYYGEDFSIWNFKDKELLETIDSGGSVEKCVFSNDNSFVLFTCENLLCFKKLGTASLKKVNITSIQRFGVFGRSYLIVISPDNALFAFNTTFDIQLWDIASLTRKSVLCCEGKSFICALVFSMDGKELIIKRSNLIEIWDIEKNERKRSIPMNIDMDIIYDAKLRWAFSNKTHLMARCFSGWSPITVIEIWNDASGEKLRTIKVDFMNAMEIALSPDGQRLAIINEKNLQILVLRPLLEKTTLKQGTQA